MRNELVRRNFWPTRGLLNDAFGFSDIDRLMDRVFTPWAGSELNETTMTEYVPRSDVEETKTHYLVSMDLPGIPKDNVKIEMMDQNTLVVSGERKNETTKTEGGYKYMERQSGSFRRVFRLPETLEAKGIEANFHDGVLEIAVPKNEKAQPQQIKISEGKSGVFSKFLGSKEANQNKAG